MIPAFFKTLNAPILLIVLIARVERVSTRVLSSSGTKTRRFCRLAYCRRGPVGLNLVARIRLEYPPAYCELFPVTAHSFAIMPSIILYTL